MKKRRWLSAVLLIAGLTLAILAALWFLMLESPRTVYAVRAETKDFPREVVGFGQVGPRRVVLAFGRQGSVAEVLVRPGDRVSEGQPLAHLDDTNLRKRLEVAESRLELARLDARQSAERFRNQLAALESDLERARAELEVQRKLLEAGAASAAQVERARQRVALLEERLAATRKSLEADQPTRRARIEALEADVAAAKEALAESRLIAPEAGVVEVVTLVPGRGASGSIVLRLPGSPVLEARFSVADGSELRPGQPSRLVFEAWPPVELETTVATVLPPEPGADWATAQFEDVAGVPEVNTQFTARVTVEVLPRAVVVPRQALVEEEGETFVWVVHLRHARRVPVRVIARNPDEVAVTGLKAGTTVLSRPPSDLKEGERLRLIEDPGN
ncbi:biotin/lipoyl-binding protein [Oceanithermus sp.]|uniref:efflux RND transporter periplasmic adaptor subunit n=1 Tax=Oceanithermus sp. TaxID=2268145 RepID=UPI0025FD5ED5|nr:biotin/lipoyl-binding protein [Oceanithermus sp.]